MLIICKPLKSAYDMGKKELVYLSKLNSLSDISLLEAIIEYWNLYYQLFQIITFTIPIFMLTGFMTISNFQSYSHKNNCFAKLGFMNDCQI